MNNPGMALKFAERNNLKGADGLFFQTFDNFISNGQYAEAARWPSINHVDTGQFFGHFLTPTPPF